MSFRKRFKYEVDAMNASTLRGDFLAAFHGPPVKVLVYRDMGDFCIFLSGNEMCTSFEPVVINISKSLLLNKLTFTQQPVNEFKPKEMH